MTSERKISANQTNAGHSTGPRSRDGKARASRNAVRHGLAALESSDPLVSEKLQKIVDRLCDENADVFQHQQAMIIAESQIMLARVRMARIAAMERMRTIDVPSYLPACVSDIERAQAMRDAGKFKFQKATRWLRALDKNAQAVFAEWIESSEAHAQLRRGKQDIVVNGVPFYSAGKRIPRDELTCFRFAFRELSALERYERRALSRRRRAIEILCARQMPTRHPEAHPTRDY